MASNLSQQRQQTVHKKHEDLGVGLPLAAMGEGAAGVVMYEPLALCCALCCTQGRVYVDACLSAFCRRITNSWLLLLYVPTDEV